MKQKMCIDIASEIGDLESVIVHPPGPEVENMTPESAQRALYSDVLNLAVLNDEYAEFEHTLEQTATVFHVQDLLEEVLAQDAVREMLIMDWFYRLCRWSLGGIFIYAGGTKLLEKEKRRCVCLNLCWNCFWSYVW
jgi:arginine deiminase